MGFIKYLRVILDNSGSYWICTTLVHRSISRARNVSPLPYRLCPNWQNNDSGVRPSMQPFLTLRHIYAPFDAVVACYISCTLLVLHLFKVFRCVCLDLTGYVYIAMVHLKLVNMFVEKQVMLPATLQDIESEI